MAYRRSFSCFALLVLSVALTATPSAYGTQAMHRPDRYIEPPHVFPVSKDTEVKVVNRRQASGKTSFAYFTNWGIYGANFQPTDINPGSLTRKFPANSKKDLKRFIIVADILYSFADTDTSGAIKLTDSYADQEKHFSSDSWAETGTNLYGCLKQLYLLKLQKRNLKVLLSVGGWTYSQAGHFNFITNPSARANFVASAVQIIEDYGFDGIDIDYEYPSNSDQGQGLADLLTSLRGAFNDLQARKGDTSQYLVTAAVAAGPTYYAHYKVAQMNKALDFWNVMAYDYSGSWLTWADNQANVYGGARTGFQTDGAVRWYLANGASANKINLGIPLYGRAFENTAGLGQTYAGVGPGTIEQGIYSYKSLPITGSRIYENGSDISSYSYDSGKRELVSYDTPNIVRRKLDYINTKGLSGSMFWELSMDKVGSESLVQVAANGLGALDQTSNHIHYPNSKWDNVRNNMGSGVPGTTTHATTLPPPTGTPSPGSGQCANVGSWSPIAAYTSGMRAIYNGHLWTAAWWTLGDRPGGPAGVWKDSGAC